MELGTSRNSFLLFSGEVNSTYKKAHTALVFPQVASPSPHQPLRNLSPSCVPFFPLFLPPFSGERDFGIIRCPKLSHHVFLSSLLLPAKFPAWVVGSLQSQLVLWRKPTGLTAREPGPIQPLCLAARHLAGSIPSALDVATRHAGDGRYGRDHARHPVRNEPRR